MLVVCFGFLCFLGFVCGAALTGVDCWRFGLLCFAYLDCVVVALLICVLWLLGCGDLLVLVVSLGLLCMLGFCVCCFVVCWLGVC